MKAIRCIRCAEHFVTDGYHVTCKKYLRGKKKIDAGELIEWLENKRDQESFHAKEFEKITREIDKRAVLAVNIYLGVIKKTKEMADERL